jgi:prephenate dehydrogenase
MNEAGFPRSVILYGTGLMGCSLALALRRQFPDIRIYGVDEHEVLDRARRLGAVEVDPEPRQAADLLVLATPVSAILKRLEELPTDTSGLILDVGSTKAAICEAAEQRRLPFIGGHPMTGSERSGPEAASPDLFKDAPFFLCPISTTPQDAVSKLTPMLKGIGAETVVLDAEKHDRLVAQLSHLPQILSTLIADQTTGDTALAGPGWKSMTRLAGSPFHVWRDILQTSSFLPQELKSFTTRLRTVLESLESGNVDDLEAIFERANRVVDGQSYE